MTTFRYPRTRSPGNVERVVQRNYKVHLAKCHFYPKNDMDQAYEGSKGNTIN